MYIGALHVELLCNNTLQVPPKALSIHITSADFIVRFLFYPIAIIVVTIFILCTGIPKFKFIK